MELLRALLRSGSQPSLQQALRLPAAAAETVRVPVLVPITGFLALEGTSQMNGALLAIREAGVGTSPNPLAVEAEVADTGVRPRWR